MIGRNIPEEIKRAVRQRSDFGCVVCGMPIYEYDHIEEFHSVGEHHPDNMVLLCPNHHREKTSRRLSKAVIKDAQANPANRHQKWSTSHQVLQTGETATIIMGGNTWISDRNIIGNKCTLITLQDQEILTVFFKITILF